MKTIICFILSNTLGLFYGSLSMIKYEYDIGTSLKESLR